MASRNRKRPAPRRSGSQHAPRRARASDRPGPGSRPRQSGPRESRSARHLRTGKDDLDRIASEIVGCELCPRLREHCRRIARSKRRAYREWDYWGRPVPGFGDPRARLLIVGLAPAAHGANRTGRMFTGDSSGDWLYRALHASGFAAQPTSVSRDDGQELHDVFISAAARCAPPDNRPLPEELERCAPYLDRELQALSEIRIILALGQIAFQTVLRLLDRSGFAIPQPRPRFGHGARARIDSVRPGQRSLTLLASYHPSRQNTQTGKLTRTMFDDVFETVRQRLRADPRS